MKTIKKTATSTIKDNGSMLTQKTNEDFNKKQPVPSDFKKKSTTNKGSKARSSENIKKVKSKIEKQNNEDFLDEQLLPNWKLKNATADRIALIFLNHGITLYDESRFDNAIDQFNKAIQIAKEK